VNGSGFKKWDAAVRGDCAAALVINHRLHESFRAAGKMLPKTGNFFPFTERLDT
jgi:hypothetical protein